MSATLCSVSVSWNDPALFGQRDHDLVVSFDPNAPKVVGTHDSRRWAGPLPAPLRDEEWVSYPTDPPGPMQRLRETVAASGWESLTPSTRIYHPNEPMPRGEVSVWVSARTGTSCTMRQYVANVRSLPQPMRDVLAGARAYLRDARWSHLA